MKTILHILFVIVCSIFYCCMTKKAGGDVPMEISYPQLLPDTIATRFLPDVVSKDGLDFNAAFSPDGKSFYFTRSKNEQWDIFVTTLDGANWCEPMLAPFSDPKYSEADPVFGHDGKLYFISNRPKKTTDTLSDFDIWFIQRMENGSWTAPENFTKINSDSAEYYLSFAANGNAYFGSSREGGFGAEDIYVSRFINGQYAQPQNLGPSINTKESEHDPCIWPDEEFIIFKSENRADGFGEADLYYSKFNSDKGWIAAANLGDQFNTNTYEYCPYLSPDLKYFFYSSEFDVKWIDAKVFKNRLEGIIR